MLLDENLGHPKHNVHNLMDNVSKFIHLVVMTHQDALAFIRYTTARHGVLAGCQIIADHLGIGLHTVYGWYKRESVPPWRLDALAAVENAVIGTIKAAE